MTALRIVMPTDPLENRRFHERLVRAGVDESEITAGVIDNAARPSIDYLVLGGMAALVRAAAAAGDTAVLDAGDLEHAPPDLDQRPVMLPATFDPSMPDGRLQTDMALIDSALKALTAPTVTALEFRNAVRSLATGIENADGPKDEDTGKKSAGDIAPSSRSVYMRYRDTIARAEKMLPSVHLSFELAADVAEQQGKWLDEVKSIIGEQTGHSVSGVSVRLGEEVGGVDHKFPFTDWVLWHTYGVRTLSLGL